VNRARRSILPWIYGGVIAAHLAFGAVTALLPTPERSEAVAIELADIKKKKDPPKPPPPPPPPAKEDKPKPPPPRPAAPSQAKMAAEAPKADALPPMPEVGADGFADLGGVSLGGGGGDGVPIGGPAPAAVAAARAQSAPKATARKTEQLAAAATGGCTEQVVKPRLKKVGQVRKYNKEAQIAEIEGVIRVQVTVDETGKVIAAHVLNSLGYGLDEIALAAANDSLFEPATLCGKPIVGTKILPFNFQLQ
jgi:periplasmic protein TonB